MTVISSNIPDVEFIDSGVFNNDKSATSLFQITPRSKEG